MFSQYDIQENPKREKKIKLVERILGQSDIVWTKYGSETIEGLARKIVDAGEKEFDN